VANLGGLVTFSMMTSVIFLLTLYLQNVRGLSTSTTGLVFGVLGLGAATGGILARRQSGASAPARFWSADWSCRQSRRLTGRDRLPRGHPADPHRRFDRSLRTPGRDRLYGITATSGLSNEEQALRQVW